VVVGSAKCNELGEGRAPVQHTLAGELVQHLPVRELGHNVQPELGLELLHTLREEEGKLRVSGGAEADKATGP